MAIDPSGMVMRLSPTQSLDLTGFARAKEQQEQLRIRREQMRLQREQFENQKQHQAEELRMRKEAEAGANARAQMEREDQAARLEAEAAAELQKNRLAAASKFGETALSGDYEGAEGFIPMMTNLGSGVDVTRNPTTGMPTYRIHHDAKADAETERLEGERNWEKAERPLDQGVFGENPDAGLAAAPTIAPVTPTGSLIDTQAMQDQRNARLGPAMQALVDAHPYDYRESAGKTAEAVMGMPMSGPKAAEEFRSQRTGPNNLIEAQLANEAKAAGGKEISEVQKSQMRKGAYTNARSAYSDQAVKGAITTIDVADRLVAALESDDAYTQQQAGQLLLQLGKVKGAASDKELGIVIGDDKASAFERAKNWINKQIEGGWPTGQKNALIAWAKKQKQKETESVFSFMDSLDRMAEGKANPYEREGVLEYRNSLPRHLINRYEEWRGQQKGAARGGAAGGKTAANTADREDIEDELLLQAADAGFDGEVIMPLMSAESGGKPSAKNPGSSAAGLFQFTDETAQAYGLDNAAAYAALPAEEQIRIGLERFKKLGLDADSTPDDFALANAAPGYIGKSDDTPVAEYRSGTKKGDAVRDKNPGWVPADGGEITVGSILDFYRKRRGGEKKGSLGVTSVGGAAPAGNTDRVKALVEKAKR